MVLVKVGVKENFYTLLVKVLIVTVTLQNNFIDSEVKTFIPRYDP